MATVTPNFNWPVPTSTDLVKDGATAIEALGDSIDASLVDLKGGTSGQVLSKNSNTDMDFTWVTDPGGDITGVTAGTGISGGGTSGTVTVTNSMATAIDAKGDLIGGTGADTFARLGVGTNGQVLTADSAETTGLKWATPAAGSTFVGCSLYRSTDLSVANATATAIPWTAEFYDTNTFHDNSTNNSRITIPSGQDGYYLITGIVLWTNNGTGQRQHIILKNGAGTGWDDIALTNAASYTVTNGARMLYLVAGDYVQLSVSQNSGGALDAFGGTTASIFQATKIG
jgi:hypothetical protein